MLNIYIKAEYSILITKPEYFPTSTTSTNASWSINVCNGAIATVEVLSKSLSANISIKNYRITKALITLLRKKNKIELEKFPKLRQAEISKINLSLSGTARKVFALIKYHLCNYEISEQLFSIKSKAWSEDGKNWKPLPSTISALFNVRGIPPLGSTEVKCIQNSLNNNVTPLLAMRHLHRAMLEEISHHKWIDATIAAELAVKEVLMRCQPILETILLEVPSPPLDKLYGKILEKYLGERSPYLSIIRKGVEIRNKLVHRPNIEKIDGKEAIDYVQNIEKAIFHLLTLLYPGDKLIKNRTRRTNITSVSTLNR